MENTEVTLLKNFMLEVLPYLFMLCGFSFSLNEKRLKTGLFFWLMTMVYIVYSIIGHAYEITAIYSGLFLLTNIFWVTTFIKPYLSFNIPTILLPLTWTGLGMYVFYKSVYLIGILMIVIGVLGLCLNAIIIKKQWNPNYWGLLFYPLISLIIVSIFFEEIQILGWCGITILCVVIIYLIKKSGTGRPMIGLRIPRKTYPSNNNTIKYSKFNRALIDKINRKNVVNNRSAKTQKEKINIICPKCGTAIPDDSIFCLKCGKKVKTSDKESDKKNTCILDRKNEKTTRINIAKKFLLLDNKREYAISGIIIGITLFAVIIAIIVNTIKCDVCNKKAIKGSDYCDDHTCSVDGCILSKPSDKQYCLWHEDELFCEWEDSLNGRCKNYKLQHGKYCSRHTCSEENCMDKISKKEYTTCNKHAINMRNRLPNPSLYFSLNSAGGIEFHFNATNSTGKDIKYIRFDIILKNSVGDLVEDEMKNTSKTHVEMIGPIAPGENASINNKIIGYCDTCAKIEIQDITIVYTDETTEKGYYGYYYEK